MKILALDPGGTTGYVQASILQTRLCEIIPGQADWDVRGLWDMLENVCPRIIVAEDFQLRGQDESGGLVLVSRDLLAVSNLWCQLHNRAYYVQSASEGKSYYTNPRLRSLNLYIRGQPHACDAMRHLLRFCTLGAGAQYLDPAERRRLIGQPLLDSKGVSRPGTV